MNTNYKNAVQALGKTASLVDKFGRESTTSAKVSMAVTGLFPIVTSFAKIDFTALKNEMKNLTDAERAEVNAEFDKDLVLENGKLEAVIENAADLLVEGRQVFESGKAFIEKLQVFYTNFKDIKTK